MAKRLPDQLNHYYLIEAVRTGIHKPILAALHIAHGKPPLSDQEIGLGIAPANRIPPSQVNTLPEQVQYAANTIRSLISMLTATGWQGTDLWDAAADRYSDRFLRRVAEGYAPPATDPAAARLEPVDADALIKAYLADLEIDHQVDDLPEDFTYVDKALLDFVERLPLNYNRLSFQRQALLEAVRLWRKLDTHQTVAMVLQVTDEAGQVEEAALDQALLEFAKQIDRYFSGYPHQREALIRLVQFWHELSSREAAIQWLSKADTYDSQNQLKLIEPALIAFVQRIPEMYRGRGDLRFGLTEGYRLWHGLDSRTLAIKQLGLDPQNLVKNTEDAATMAQAAIQIDQALLNFWGTVPTLYDGTPDQQEAILSLVMIWRRIDSRIAVIQSLFEDLRRMELANRDAIDAMPLPNPRPLLTRPDHWTLDNLELGASIVPSGHFTWAEATQGGIHLPPNQVTVDAIIRIATLAQEARDRIGRPFHIITWYTPTQGLAARGETSMNRHGIGDAIAFYCDGLTGQQLYWSLDPWWPAGLGLNQQYPYLCYLDARSYRARWLKEPTDKESL